MGKGPNPKRGESLPVCTPSAQFQDVHQGKATRRPASLQQDALGAALRESVCEPTTIPIVPPIDGARGDPVASGAHGARTTVAFARLRAGGQA